MPESVVVRVSHRYNAPVERVFDAWLTPTQAARFLFATRTGNILQCEIEPHVGGGFTVTDRRPNPDTEESFFEAEHRGTYLQIERGSRLVFEFSVAPHYAPPTRVALDFLPLGASICEIVLTHELGNSDDARAWAEATRRGWARMLDELDKILAPRIWALRTLH